MHSFVLVKTDCAENKLIKGRTKQFQFFDISQSEKYKVYRIEIQIQFHFVSVVHLVLEAGCAKLNVCSATLDFPFSDFQSRVIVLGTRSECEAIRNFLLCLKIQAG